MATAKRGADFPMTVSSYRSALKATSITGLSQAVVLLFRMVRVKVVAVLLGPEGVGVFGILSNVANLVSTVVGMGITGSAVRQVAEAAASGDAARVSRVVWTLRRTALVLGCLGGLAVVLLATPISVLSIGTAEYATSFAFLGGAVLLASIHSGQTALLRGLRMIPALAKLNIWGAFWGTVASVPLVWLWGIDGVAPAILVAMALSLLASWWHARKIPLARVMMTRSLLAGELKGLFGLGLMFLATEALGAAVQFGLRAILAHDVGLVAVGEFQAAAALSMVYLTFVLQPMAQDFYPHLTGIAKDDIAVNRLVNEQAELSLFLVGPGILMVVALAPWLIALLYSKQFSAAVDVLRWQCLGVLLRVVSWPIRYVLLARGERGLFITTEVAAHTFHLGAFWLLVQAGGLPGAGFGLGVAYLFYLPLIYFVVRRVSGFRWSRTAFRNLATMSAAYAAAMLCIFLAPEPWGSVGAMAIAVGVATYVYLQLGRMTSMSLAGSAVKKFSGIFRRRRSGSG